jgi:hypothetical protein
MRIAFLLDDFEGQEQKKRLAIKAQKHCDRLSGRPCEVMGKIKETCRTADIAVRKEILAVCCRNCQHRDIQSASQIPAAIRERLIFTAPPSMRCVRQPSEGPTLRPTCPWILEAAYLDLS